MPTQQHAEVATSAASMGAKLAGIWSAVGLAFTSWPWAQIAAALAALASLHVVVGWWLDRLGISLRLPRRKGRR